MLSGTLVYKELQYWHFYYANKYSGSLYFLAETVAEPYG